WEVGDVLFFFSSRRRHTRLVSDWSSDVCSSDLSRYLCLERHLEVDLGRARIENRRAQAVDGHGGVGQRYRDRKARRSDCPGRERSEERRVGKEGRAGGGAGSEKEKGDTGGEGEC